ncbi:Uncharacterized protein OBRU01_06635 [Operophtera brumata]|uniref:Uncharacterized protein n=1 Tax=Operophtera brumata TaxID=104452 RepID=A0A0L7LKD8_OPEBR|nr:Uncharacterized protein OBRU01_06635 [Operophtera brumata]
MSFITKRERVFNEYALYDIPARNEGKLKAYASCTDARAWSHFCSDKSEHLVEIIKRNNDVCRAKYVPTEAIVNTLMVSKNTEIARLHRKIDEFEQLLAAYDDLELTCDQKCEIAKATSGKDTRCIDIKGKILFKLKVFEKFSLALIAPCSQDTTVSSTQDCCCYRADVVARVETTYALTAAESKQPCIDNKRAQLVAEIMENDEMKEILCKENPSLKSELEIDDFGIEQYNIESENLKRLKNLQENYDDLMTCYEALKHEKDCLLVRCRKYEELEKEFEGLKDQLREYSSLWNEKEHYQRRSADLDSLKEQYLVLSEETSNLELQLKAESAISKVKAKTIDDLRHENLLLEQKLNEASMLFEKEKNSLQCKMKECDCKSMCQDQQIKIRDKINSLNEQITNLKDVCYCNDEEKQQMQGEFQTKLNLINDLKMQIEDWKSEYEKILQRNNYLEKYTDVCRDDVQKLIERNSLLTEDVEDKITALENLRTIINNKSMENNRLMEDIEKRNTENNNLYKQIETLQENYKRSFAALDIEKTQVIKSLQLARQESQELLEKVKDYDDMVNKQDDFATTFQSQKEKYYSLQSLLKETNDQNKNLQKELSGRDSNNSILLQEVQELREVNQFSATKISDLQAEKKKYKLSLELTKKESIILKEKLQKFENLSDQLKNLKDSHESLVGDKIRLENELQNKTGELDDALHSIQLKRQESEELMKRLHVSENLKTNLSQLNDAYTKIVAEKQTFQNDLTKKINDYNNLLQSFDHFKLENKQQSQEVDALNHDLDKLKRAYDNLVKEKINLQTDFNNKTNELNNLYNTLEMKKEEVSELRQRLSNVENDQKAVTSSNHSLLQENISAKNNFAALKKESVELMRKVKYYEGLELDYDKLKINHDQMQAEKNKLQSELDHQQMDLRKIQRENHDLSSQIILARDDRIALLENQINKLEEEVRQLHTCLDEAVSTGEDITNHSSQKIDQSRLSMEAHHSRATHNMKMEIAQLQRMKTMLENRLSATNIRNEETSRDKHKYLSQISHLQNERGVIVNEIKQLEMRSVGDSALSPESCDVENILGSLDRIKKMLDVRSSKSSSLEQTLLSVQNSYQLVQTKTDEAKKIVEKEKQKIVNEKEEAIKDKINMENQLIDLKKKLEQQILYDKNLIKDLEAEILNQKLIIDKVNQSTQSYISKLEDDMKTLQELYQSTQTYISKLEDDLKSLQLINKNSLDKTNALENKLSEEKSRYIGIIEKTNIDLEEKIKEVGLLNKTLSELKKKPGRDMNIQTMANLTNRNVVPQTDDEIKYKELENSDLLEKYDTLGEYENYKDQVNKTTHDTNSISNKKAKPAATAQQVQVLTANIDPSFNCIRSTYLNYKLKQLSPGRLEHYSISYRSESIDTINKGLSSPDEGNPSQVILESEFNSKIESKTPILKVIDIYNKKSMNTSSSKAVDNDDTENEADANIGTNKIKIPEKSSEFIESGLTNESFATGSINNEFKDSNLFGSTSEVSTDRDLFVIYKDSESNHDRSYEKKEPWNINGNSEIVVESVIIHHNKHGQENSTVQRSHNKYSKKQEIDSEPFINAEGEEYEEDDSVKHKLKISLPRVEHYSPSIEASDTDKKSVDSYTMSTFPSPDDNGSHIKFKDDKFRIPSSHSISQDKQSHRDATKTITEQIRNVNIRKKAIKTDNNKFTDPEAVFRDNLRENESHHKLSRIGANFVLLNSEKDRIESNLSSQQNSRNFGLDYILQSQNYPDNIKTYNAAKALRKTRSDERFNLSKPERSDSSPSRLSQLKKSSTDCKTISSNSVNKTSDNSQLVREPKSIERCVMVKLDNVEEYENKIHHLTKTLENIEKDYKKKIEAIKMQYDNNIKSILNEHNQGVESIQSLHEETLQDILKIHENEVENLRTMSIEAMRKADKLEKENNSLKNKIRDSSSCLHEVLFED